MGDEDNGVYAADRNRVGDPELVIAHVGARRSEHEGEIVRNPQVLAAVHAHADQQLRAAHRGGPQTKVVILQQTAHWRIAIGREHVVRRCDGKYL